MNKGPACPQYRNRWEWSPEMEASAEVRGDPSQAGGADRTEAGSQSQVCCGRQGWKDTQEPLAEAVPWHQEPAGRASLAVVLRRI